MKKLLFLLLSFSGFTQNQAIKIELDPIDSTDSLSFRKYTIHYSIKNNSNDTLSFFLNPESVNAGSGGSMQTNISASLFQEKEELPMHSILSRSTKNIELPKDFESMKDGKEKDKILRKYLKEALDINIDEELGDIIKNDTTYQFQKSSERLMKSVMTLKPHEIKQYSKTFYWDKKRYHKIDEMEYYINENSSCFLLLYIVLLKEEHKEGLLESDYNALMKIPNFLKGWYNSNKVEINFKE